MARRVAPACTVILRGTLRLLGSTPPWPAQRGLFGVRSPIRDEGLGEARGMGKALGFLDSFRAGKSLYVPLVVVCYAASSLGGVFVNKACLSAFNFGYPNTIMLCQLAYSVLSLTILRAAGVLDIPSRSWREVTYLLYPAVLLILNVTVGLVALKLVNIPMFSAFRRLSVIAVMLLEYYFLGRTASRKVIFCVAMMVCGSVIAALGDLTLDPLGYSLVILNNFITAGNLVAIKKASQVVRLDALPLFYYVSIAALPMVFTIAIASGELVDAVEAIRVREDLPSFLFVAALGLSAASAFSVNFFTNLCTQVTSPLTTAITGQTKNILQTLLGIFTWGYKPSFLNLLGLVVALFASSSFAYVKYEEGTQNAATKVAEESTVETIKNQSDTVGSQEPAGMSGPVEPSLKSVEHAESNLPTKVL